MIEKHWATPIYSHQYTDDDDWNHKLDILLKAKMTDMKSEGHTNIADVNVSFKPFPDIMDRFKTAFDELCDVYEHPKNYNITDLNIINPMNFGDYKSVHSHDKIDAFGIFYVDVGAETSGGHLKLYDPRWQNQKSFVGSKPYMEIVPKKGLLIAAPHYVWHEVTPYVGDLTRLSLVCNMQFNEIVE
jgi:hypothetical protein